jgi:acyl-coenzyme A synthetase/AMP-(fatty) acid ligase
MTCPINLRRDAMEQGGWQYKEIHTILGEVAERYPSKVYIQSPDQQKGITFAQTNIWCNKIANFLKGQGIKANDKIALIGENSIETLMIYWGVLNYGATICPINVGESQETVYHALNLAKPRIVFHGQELAFDQERYRADLWMPYSDIDSGQERDFFALLKDRSSAFSNPVSSKDDIAEVSFTSGTTGLPKGVVYKRDSLLYMSLEVIDRWKVTERDVILDYRAYSWTSVQAMSIFSSLITGATLVFARRFSRTRFPSWLKDYGVTICIGVPTVINFLLQEEVPLHKKDIPSLRFMTSSTAPLAPQNLISFEERYGIPINQGAGSGETGWIAFNDPEDLSHPERRKIGSIGRVPRNKEVLILDEHGKKRQTGEEGEIVVKSEATALGYLQPDGEVSKFPDDGVRTGDIGYIDSDGHVYITGRKKDVIIRGGVNISPIEITNWLMENPAVQEAATIGVPDKTYGEEVASFIVPKEGSQINQEDIINHCKKKFPDFKLPKTVSFIEQIPKTERQKVAKGELLKIWEERYGKK